MMQEKNLYIVCIGLILIHIFVLLVRQFTSFDLDDVMMNTTQKF